MGSYFSIPYVPKRAATVEVSTVKCEAPVLVPTLVAADLKTEAEPKIRIPLTNMETAITKEVDQLLDQKREPDENKKAIQGLLTIVEDMQKIIEPKVEVKEEPKKVKEEPKVDVKEEPKKVKEEPKVEKEEKKEEKVEVNEEPKVEKEEPKEEKKEEKVEVNEEQKVEPKVEDKKEEKKGEYKEALKDLLREAHLQKEPALPVIMEEPVVERKLSITIPSSSPTNPPMPEMNKKKKKK
jgi:hypothetical protein